MSTTSITPITKHTETADSFRRIEVITGTGRRRRWSEAEKAAIVEETFKEGAVVSVIAQRHGVAASQVFAWRKEARERSFERAGVTPVVVQDKASEPEPPAALQSVMIEVEVEGAKLRIPPHASPRTIQAIMEGLAALKRRR